MGLGQVKNLTNRTIDRVIREQPFLSLEDFLSRVDPRTQEAENLARIGAWEIVVLALQSFNVCKPGNGNQDK